MPSHTHLFEDIDRMDPDAWIAHLAPDVVMRFGNDEPAYGRAACRERAQSLFERVDGVAHHIVARWIHGDATIVETSATFTMPDGDEHTLPMVTIYRTDLADLIADYRVYLDPSPIDAPQDWSNPA